MWSARTEALEGGVEREVGVEGGVNHDITTTSSTMTTKEGRKYGIHRVVDIPCSVDVNDNVTITIGTSSSSLRGIELREAAWSDSEQWSPVPFVTGLY